MKDKKKNLISLIFCYVFWGFQPLYWNLIPGIDSYTILGSRIVMAALFSFILLAVTKRLPELKALFGSKAVMKYLVPAVVFLFLDWAVFIVAVNSGHVLDVSLGYYINPLMLFAFGVIFYKEKCTKMQLLALGIAAVGVVISTVAFGNFPFLSLVIAINWALYAVLKKNVKVDGVVSICAETLLLTPFAIAFLLLFRRPEFAAFGTKEILFLAGSGVVTALPMFLYSNCVAAFPLITMCFAQYLSPTFNMICGLIMGESFSKSQITSLIFFVAAIVLFTISEVRQIKNNRESAKTQTEK